jgi:hypothetical protein
MAGFAAYIPLAMSAASSIASAAQAGKSNDYAAQLAGQRQEALAADYQARERKRQNLLEQQMASQRARLGALGVGSTGGSGQALMEGLAQRSAEDSADDAAATSSSMAAIQSQYAQRSGSSSTSLLSLANSIAPAASKGMDAFTGGGDSLGGGFDFNFGA